MWHLAVNALTLLGFLHESLPTSALTLVALLDESQAASVRLAAARAIMSDLIAMQDHAELVKRVAELEARLDGTQRPPESPRALPAPDDDGMG
jgi:hypothetical protein